MLTLVYVANRYGTPILHIFPQIPKMIAIVVLFFFLSGCMVSPPINWNVPSETEIRVQITNDDFKKEITYIGPDIAKGFGDSLFIRAWRKYRSPYVVYQIYILDRYGGEWRYYDSAYDYKGNNLNVTQISSDVDCGTSGCVFKEHVGVNINRSYLEESKKTGIQIKLYGKAGQEIFFIPGGYVQGFLAKVDSSTAEQ